MTIQKYSSPTAQRVTIRAEAKLLKHVEALQVLGSFGMNKEQPLNSTDTTTFRRTKPFNSTSAEVPNIDPQTLQTSEGVTPKSHTIEFADVPVTQKQYAVLYQYSSAVDYMYEDDVPAEMIKQAGDTLGEALEIVCYGQLKSGSNVIYTNGTTRAGLNTKLSLNSLRQAARNLGSNRAMTVTKKISGGKNYGSTPVAPSFIVFIHTDVSADARDLEHFRSIEEYGGAFTPVHKDEIGKCEEFRIVASPLFAPFLAGGAVVGTSGMYAADATNCDVYPVCVIGEDCLGHVSLKGHGKSAITPNISRSSDINHANPSGMFGYVSVDAWYAAVRLNDNWMTRIECCVTKLTG